jgi:hypothetical protein
MFIGIKQQLHGSSTVLVGSLLLTILLFCVAFFVLLVFVLCLVHPMLPDSLDCPFMAATSVFSKVRFLLFLTLSGPLDFMG